MNVLFVNDSTTNTNWGDRAAATSLMAMVRASGGEIVQALTEDELRSSRFGAGSGTDLRAQGAGAPRASAGVRQAVDAAGRARRAKRRLLAGRDGGDPADSSPGAGRISRPAPKSCAHGGYGWPDVLATLDEADVAVIHGDGAMVGDGVIARTDLFLTYLVKRHFASRS